jgi:hypothetical protein
MIFRQLFDSLSGTYTDLLASRLGGAWTKADGHLRR